MTNLIGKTLHRLGAQLPGRVSWPGQDRYAAATAIWAKSDHSPHAVVHCQTAEHVQAAIRAARSCDLPLCRANVGMAGLFVTGLSRLPRSHRSATGGCTKSQARCMHGMFALTVF